MPVRTQILHFNESRQQAKQSAVWSSYESLPDHRPRPNRHQWWSH